MATREEVIRAINAKYPYLASEIGGINKIFVDLEAARFANIDTLEKDAWIIESETFDWIIRQLETPTTIESLEAIEAIEKIHDRIAPSPDQLFAEVVYDALLESGVFTEGSEGLRTPAWEEYLDQKVAEAKSLKARMGWSDEEVARQVTKDVEAGEYISQAAFEEGQAVITDANSELRQQLAAIGIDIGLPGSISDEALDILSGRINAALNKIPAGTAVTEQMAYQIINDVAQRATDPRDELNFISSFFSPDDPLVALHHSTVGRKVPGQTSKVREMITGGKQITAREKLAGMQETLTGFSGGIQQAKVSAALEFGLREQTRELGEVYDAPGALVPDQPGRARTPQPKARTPQQISAATLKAVQAGEPIPLTSTVLGIDRGSIIAGLEAQGKPVTEEAIANIMTRAEVEGPLLQPPALAADPLRPDEDLIIPRRVPLTGIERLPFQRAHLTEWRTDPLTGEPIEVPQTGEDPSLVAQNIADVMRRVPSALATFGQTLTAREQETLVSQLPQIQRDYQEKARQYAETVGGAFRLTPEGESFGRVPGPGGVYEPALPSFKSYLEKRQRSGKIPPAPRPTAAIPRVTGAGGRPPPMLSFR